MSKTRRSRKNRRPPAPAPRAAKRKRNRRKLDRLQLRKQTLRDGCTGKRKIADKDEAIEIAREMLDRRPREQKIGVYLCDVCGHMHITSRASGGCWLVVERDEEGGSE